MALSLRSRSLSGNGRLYMDETDPMANVANISDAMLVLAVALMVALLSYWQMDMPTMTELNEETDMTEVDDMESMSEQILNGESGLNELGKVYYDPKTGKLWMLTEDLPEEIANGGLGDDVTE